MSTNFRISPPRPLSRSFQKHGSTTWPLPSQSLAQLKEHTTHGILGNIGTLVSFRVGSEDADILSKELGGVISQKDLMGLSNWNAYIRLLIRGNVDAPFNMQTLLPGHTPHPKTKEDIIALSRKRYGRDRKAVEKEILSTWILADEGE